MSWEERILEHYENIYPVLRIVPQLIGTKTFKSKVVLLLLPTTQDCFRIIKTNKLSENKRPKTVDLNNCSAAHKKCFNLVMRQDPLWQMTQVCCNTCINSCVI